jgi:hypothetical protein
MSLELVVILRRKCLMFFIVKLFKSIIKHIHFNLADVTFVVFDDVFPLGAVKLRQFVLGLGILPTNIVVRGVNDGAQQVSDEVDDKQYGYELILFVKFSPLVHF